MAICVVTDVNNKLEAVLTSAADCSSYILVDANEYQLLLQTYAISPLEIAEAFTWGFGTYITFWWLGYIVKNARRVIKII